MKNKLVPIVGILLVLGIGGFIFFQQKSSPPVSPEIKKAQQEVLANCKYDSDFCKYAANALVTTTGGYTMISESTFEGKKTKMVLKTDGKNNSESSTYLDGKEQGNVISLNEITYMKNPGETVWTEFPSTKDETGKKTTNLLDFEKLNKESGNAKDSLGDVENTFVVKKVGSEKCGAYTCSIFETTYKETPDSTTKIWVDTKEYLARKMESKSIEGVSTITFEYGLVTITKPSPVKKMEGFDQVTQDAGTNVNELIPSTSPQESAPVEETPAE